MCVRRWLLTPVALLLTGCAALASPHADSPGAGVAASSVIPWTSTTPTASETGLATPVEGAAPTRCQAGDVKAGFKGYQAGGRVVGDIILNARISDCLLGGTPTIRLLAAQGPVPMTQATTVSTPSADIVLQRLIVTTLDAKAGVPPALITGGAGVASIHVAWHGDDPGKPPCAGLAQASSMQLVLPGQSDPINVEQFWVTEGKPVAVCPPVLEVGAISQDGIDKPIDSLRYWNYTLSAPASARAGTTMTFRVILQNIYYRPLEFRDGCPRYIEDLAGPDGWTNGKIYHTLNCASLGSIAPGQEITFEIKVDIPGSAAAGSYMLAWDLDTGDVNYGAATAAFSVT